MEDNCTAVMRNIVQCFQCDTN